MPPRVRSQGLQALVNEFIGDDPERVESFERACADLKVGAALNRLRTEAGLSARALAERVGTKASVISRIEQADYEGHSLSMLRRVAAALGREVEIRFPPIKAQGSAPGGTASASRAPEAASAIPAPPKTTDREKATPEKPAAKGRKLGAR